MSEQTPEIPLDVRILVESVMSDTDADAIRERIANLIMAERKANEQELESVRDWGRVAYFGSDANHAVAELTRKFAKEILGKNVAFVDDDLRLLANLADIAVSHNLYGGMPEDIRVSIEQLRAERRKPRDS